MWIRKIEYKKARSFFELCHLLREIIFEPFRFYEREDLFLACKSRKALAKFSDQEREIITSSTVAISELANEMLKGGVKELDQLRTAARNAMKECMPAIRARTNRRIIKI